MNTLDYNDLMQFMKEFEIDYLNRFEELIIDELTNTYVSIRDCKNIDDLTIYVVYAICRPIGKGLEDKDAKRLLKKFNNYFKTNLKRSDFRLMYGELCYSHKLNEFKNFIKRGFPIEELEKF